MNKALLSALAVLHAVSFGQAQAKDLLLRCTLAAGSQVSLAIGHSSVLIGGQRLKNLDLSSVVVGARYINFNQAFPAYYNAWTIDRSSRQFSLKTTLKSNAQVVIEERGTCADAATVSRHVPQKSATSFSEALSVLRLQ